MKLHLGCGNKRIDGYINVDLQGTPDVRCDLKALPDEWTGKADEVLAVHVLEHFGFVETQAVLLEWRRVLKPGGKIAIECPNLRQACLNYLKDRTNTAYGLWPIYGNQDDATLSVHKSGWEPDTLMDELKRAGFRDAKQAPAEWKKKEPRDFRVEAIR